MTKVRISPGKFILSILFIAFIIYSLVTIVSQAMQIRNDKALITVVSEKVDEEKKRSTELDEEVSKIGSDEYVEKQARDKLGYVKSNEKIFYDKSKN